MSEPKKEKSKPKAEAAAEEEQGEKKQDPSNPDVVTKYKKAGEIANAAVQLVAKACVVGAKVVELCSAGDRYIVDETAKIYKADKKLDKGVAFPTCVSLNNVVGHFSPVASDVVLKENDLVKIDLGVHIDGFVAVVAHTLVLNNNQPVKGRQADVIAAAHTALEGALRLVKPGAKNTAVTELIGKVAADYKCNAVQGVLSHEMKRFEIDAPKVILNRGGDPESKVEEFEFGVNEVYALDLVMSTGEGKPKDSDDDRTSVYKRAVENSYQLKITSSRTFFREVQKRFPSFPFTLRALEDEKKARVGVKECVTHELLVPYPVLLEKEGEFVAHLKATVLLTEKGILQVSGVALDRSKLVSECKVSEDVNKVLNTAKAGGGGAKKNKGKKKKKPAGDKPKKEGDKKEKAKAADKDAKPADKPADKAEAKKEGAAPKSEKKDKGSKKDKSKDDKPKDAAAEPKKEAAPADKKEDAPKSSKKDSKKQDAAAPKAEAAKAEAPKSSKKQSKGAA